MKKERPSPKEIEGRQALFVVNLAPRKVAGEISWAGPLIAASQHRF